MQTTQITKIDSYEIKTQNYDLINQHIFIGCELYTVTKQSKLYLYLNKLTSKRKARLSTSTVFYQSSDSDYIVYNKFTPIVCEKMKVLISKITIHKIDNMNFDYYYKFDGNTYNIGIINSIDDCNTDINNNMIIYSYRNYYRVVDLTTNIYGEISDHSAYYESFIPEYREKLLNCITNQTDDYIYNLVGKQYEQFKYEKIKPVLEHLRGGNKENKQIKAKKSLSFKVITKEKMYSDSFNFARDFKYKTVETLTGYEFFFKNEDDYMTARDLTDYSTNYKNSKLYKWVF
jgi:hypothetical protein